MMGKAQKVCDYTLFVQTSIITLVLALEVLAYLVCAAVVRLFLPIHCNDLCHVWMKESSFFLPGNFVEYLDSPLLLDAVLVPVAEFFLWSHSCRVPNLYC
jgi:hypothetical protein